MDTYQKIIRSKFKSPAGASKEVKALLQALRVTEMREDGTVWQGMTEMAIVYGQLSGLRDRPRWARWVEGEWTTTACTEHGGARDAAGRPRRREVVVDADGGAYEVTRRRLWPSRMRFLVTIRVHGQHEAIPDTRVMVHLGGGESDEALYKTLVTFGVKPRGRKGRSAMGALVDLEALGGGEPVEVPWLVGSKAEGPGGAMAAWEPAGLVWAPEAEEVDAGLRALFWQHWWPSGEAAEEGDTGKCLSL